MTTIAAVLAFIIAAVTIVALTWDRGAAVPRPAAIAAAPTGSPLPPDQDGPPWVPFIGNPTAAGSVVLPAALTSSSDPGPSVVTPESAGRVLTATWSVRNRALADQNRALLAELESGAALELDDAFYGDCGCEGMGPLAAIVKSQVYVALQPAYPATFLAEVQTTFAGDPWLSYLVFRRTTAATPWQIVLNGGYAPQSPALDPVAADPGGFDLTVTTPDVPYTTELASYWQTWKDTGSAPATDPFLSGSFSDGWGHTLAQYGQGRVNGSNGLVGHYRFQADPGAGQYSFAANGYIITCAAIQEEKTWTAPGSAGVYQDPGLKNWGKGLPAGVYSSVVQVTLYEPCFLDPADSTPIGVTAGTEFTVGHLPTP